jgi:hypothetical protein
VFKNRVLRRIILLSKDEVTGSGENSIVRSSIICIVLFTTYFHHHHHQWRYSPEPGLGLPYCFRDRYIKIWVISPTINLF